MWAAVAWTAAAEEVAPDQLGAALHAMAAAYGPLAIDCAGFGAKEAVDMTVTAWPEVAALPPRRVSELAEHQVATGRRAQKVPGGCGVVVERGNRGWRVSPVGTCAGADVTALASQTPPPPPEPADLVEVLVALPAAERTARLAQEREAHAADAEQVSRFAQAEAVSGSLDRTGRTDPSVVRLFLRAALSADPTLRAEAVRAAAASGDPPVTSAAPVEAAPPPPPVEARLALDAGTWELGGSASLLFLAGAGATEAGVSLTPSAGLFVADRVELGLFLNATAIAGETSFLAAFSVTGYGGGDALAPYLGAGFGAGQAATVWTDVSYAAALVRAGMLAPVGRSVAADLGLLAEVDIVEGRPYLVLPVGFFGLRVFLD